MTPIETQKQQVRASYRLRETPTSQLKCVGGSLKRKRGKFKPIGTSSKPGGSNVKSKRGESGLKFGKSERKFHKVKLEFGKLMFQLFKAEKKSAFRCLMSDFTSSSVSL